MKLGAYTACLHDRSLDETLKILGELGLTSAEINAGGFIPAPHLPIDDILASDGAREDYLGRFTQAGITLTGLNVNGNPLNPDPEVGPKHAEDLRRAIEVAAALGVKRVVTMSGLPQAHPGGTAANWVVNPWDSQYLDILDYQWDVAVPFWKDVNARAAAADVKVCIEMHPHNLVFNPPTLQRLGRWTPATCSGRAWIRSPASSTSATWSSTPPPRTPGSIPTTSASTACWTTASPARRRTATRCTSAGATP
jgi:sugar phosphate isomerase/epimerase